MDVAFFFYTVGLIGVALITCSVSLVVWLMTRRRDSFVAAIGFAVYALDLSLIFFDEYVRAKHSYPETFNLPLTHPWLSFVLGVLILVCIWVWTLLRTKAGVTPRSLATFTVPTALLCLLFLPRSSYVSTIQQWCYWMMRDGGVVACLLYALWRYKYRATSAERSSMDRSKIYFRIACILIAAVIVEDTFMILLYRPSGDSYLLDSFLWHLTERNISENFLMVVSAFFMFRRYREILTVYSHHPQAEQSSLESNSNHSDLSSTLALFAERCGLSAREQEVVELIVRGQDVQGVADTLVISPGTVKSHLHRIYRKAGVSGRQGLIDAFWKS